MTARERITARLSLGTGPLGNQYERISDAQAHATIHAALDAGIRRFDTAPHYGAGVAERRLGDALTGVARDAFEISTKVGRLLVPRSAGRPKTPAPFLEDPGIDRRWDFSRDGVLRSLDESMRRLGVDRVDTVFLHDPDEHWREASTRAYPVLEALRDEGAVRSIGIGVTDVGTAARWVAETGIDRVLLAGRYTLLEHGPAVRDLLDRCAERGVAVMAAGVLNSGILADPRPGAPYEYEPAPPDVLARAQAIAAACRAAGVDVLAAALQFPLGHPAVAEVLVGARSAAEVDADIRALGAAVPPGLWARLLPAGVSAPSHPTA